MKKIYKLTIILFISLFFVKCSKEDKFLIDRNRVGVISNENTIADIEHLYKKDSVVVRLSEGDLGGEDTKYIQDDDKYLVYSKEGKHLLTIVPKKQHDSTSRIKYVEVMDIQFKTEKKLSLQTPFKEINMHYMINKVETSLSSATLYIDELNATLAMRKKEIGVSEFSQEKVVLEQIPDLAKINHFTIWFD